jgi:hypothetical protein
MCQLRQQLAHCNSANQCGAHSPNEDLAQQPPLESFHGCLVDVGIGVTCMQHHLQRRHGVLFRLPKLPIRRSNLACGSLMYSWANFGTLPA